jgi:hypothetical protein
MTLRQTLTGVVAVGAAALVVAAPVSAAPPTPCEAPGIGINMCIVSVSHDLVDGQADGKVWIKVEVVSASAVQDGSMLATAVTTSPTGVTSSQTLIDNRSFTVDPGRGVIFRVQLDPPAGETEIDFSASVPSIGFPYGYSTVSVTLTSA